MGALTTTPLAEEIERVLVQGDIGRMPPDMRLEYYRNICVSLGLNPLTKPFEYLTLQGKTILYAKKDATDQLRKIHGVSINIVSRETLDGVYVVTARATDKHGRQDESLGALPLPASPVERANAIMKCETKAKRRVTLSICGLGMLDETEIETIPGSRERQQDYLRSRGIDPDAPSTVKPEVIRELADKLDEPPQVVTLKTGKALPTGGIELLELRHAKQVAEADAALKEVAKPPAKKITADAIEVRKAFTVMKDALHATTGSDDIYYNTLKAYGYTSGKDIPNMAVGQDAYRALGQLVNRIKEEKLLRSELELADKVYGHEPFMRVLGANGCASIDDCLCLASEPLEALRSEIKALGQ